MRATSQPRCVGSPTVGACANHLAPVPQASTLPPSRNCTHTTWCRGGLPRRPCLSSGNEPFARGQWDCTLKAPPYHAPGYLLLRSGPDGTSTFRCPRPSVSLPSEQYLWARGSAPKKGDIRSKCSHKERRLYLVFDNRKAKAHWLPLRGRPPRHTLNPDSSREKAFRPEEIDLGLEGHTSTPHGLH